MGETETYEIENVYGEVRYAASDRGVLRYRIAPGELFGDSKRSRGLRATIIADVLGHATPDTFDLYVIASATYEDGTRGEPQLVGVDQGPEGTGIVLGVRHV